MNTTTNPCACPSPEVVTVPGSPGNPGTNGTNGTNGVNAYSLTTGNLTIPNTGGSVNVGVSSTAWNVIGQYLFISDGVHFAHFQVQAVQASPPQLTVASLGYNGDGLSGSVIASGATVVPGGVQGTAGATATATQSAATGGAQALTNSPAQALAATLTLSSFIGKTYLLFARLRLDYVGATFAANQTVTLTIRRTNNTAANLISTTLETAVVTTVTYGLGELTAMVPYTTVNAGDVIQAYVSVSTAPSAGSLNVVEAAVTALELT